MVKISVRKETSKVRKPREYYIRDMEYFHDLFNLTLPTHTKKPYADINELTLQDSGSAVVVDSIKLRNTKSFPVNDQEYVVPRKSIFNRIVGDSHLELRFASCWLTLHVGRRWSN